MKPINNTANDLFQKLRARFSPVTLGNDSGESTGDPTESRFFNFIYKEEDGDDVRTIGPVTISLVDGRSMKVYYSDQILKKITNRAEWYALLRELRAFAKRNLLTFDARDIAKQQLDARDFKWLGDNDGQLSIDDIPIKESVMYGTKRKSYQTFESVKLIVQHTKSVDENIPGARSRSIDAIFLERSDGERYKFPYNYLTGARAMARHVHEGGTPYDDGGQAILAVIKEMRDLGQFARMTRNHAMENEESGLIRQKVIERYHSLKKTIAKIGVSESEYRDFVSTFKAPDVVDSGVEQQLRERFTKRVWNDRMEELLPSVSRALADTPVDDCDCGMLVLHDDPDADNIAIAYGADDITGRLTTIMKDIAARAVDQQIANFAHDVDVRLRDASLDKLDDEMKTRAMALSTQYINDLIKMLKDENYRNTVRIVAVSDDDHEVDSFDEMNEFETWADSITESYSESERHAEYVMSRLKKMPVTIGKVYAILNKYRAYAGDVFNLDEVAQIMMDRCGIHEGAIGGGAAASNTTASATSSQDRMKLTKKANDVVKVAKAAGININPNQVAQSIAAGETGKPSPKPANVAKMGLGDKLMKAAASDPKKAAALTAMMRKIGESEELTESLNPDSDSGNSMEKLKKLAGLKK